MIYIVLGPGRTGSNLICHMLGNDGKEPEGMLFASRTKDDSKESLEENIEFLKLSKRWRGANIIVHSHDPNIIHKLGIDPKECILIISKRRNLFELVMSHAVTRRTREWSAYTDKTPSPSRMDPSIFLKWCEGFRDWYKDIDLTLPYNKVIEVYYEDICNIEPGFRHLATLLGVEVKYKTLPRANPHRYQDWISNWQELYNLMAKK